MCFLIDLIVLNIKRSFFSILILFYFRFLKSLFSHIYKLFLLYKYIHFKVSRFLIVLFLKKIMIHAIIKGER